MAKIDIDFSIHSSPFYLKVVDLSVWGLIESKTAIVEIVLPGYEGPEVKFFDKHKLNVFNSNLLGTSCDGCKELTTLPDGIYKITVKGSPSKYSKSLYFLKTDLFDMEVDKILIDNIDKLDDKLLDEKTYPN